MNKAVWIWVVRLVSLCVLGPLGGSMMSSLRAADGSVHATPFVSGSVLSGLFAIFGVFFLAMIGGVIGAKAVSLREGIFNMGLVVLWGAWGSGRVGEALRGAPESGSLMMLAIEGVVVVVMLLWVLLMLTKSAKRDHDEHAGDLCVALNRDAITRIRGNLGGSGLQVLIGLGVSMVLVWLQVQNDLSGQSVWGGFIGAAIAGVFGGMVLKNHSLNVETSKGRKRGAVEMSLVPVIFGVALGAVVGPIVSMVVPGGGKILESIASGQAPGWMLMSSLGWAGGALVGTPIGYSWVESSVARQQAGEQGSNAQG